jgi:cytidine deaminase
MPVICINREGKYRILSLGELLPFAFSKKDME